MMKAMSTLLMLVLLGVFIRSSHALKCYKCLMNCDSVGPDAETCEAPEGGSCMRSTVTAGGAFIVYRIKSTKVITKYHYSQRDRQYVVKTKIYSIHIFITARCTIVQSAVLRLHVVRLSVRLSVTLVNQDHIRWKNLQVSTAVFRALSKYISGKDGLRWLSPPRKKCPVLYA